MFDWFVMLKKTAIFNKLRFLVSLQFKMWNKWSVSVPVQILKFVLFVDLTAQKQTLIFLINKKFLNTEQTHLQQ